MFYRYNRRVKPNRRYTPSEDISNSGTSDEGEEGGVRKEGDTEQKKADRHETGSSGGEETVQQPVRARTKTGQNRSRK